MSVIVKMTNGMHAIIIKTSLMNSEWNSFS